MRSWHIPPKMQITMQINLRDYAEIRPGDQLKVQAHIPYLDSIIESGWTEVSVASHENPSNSKKNELNLSRQDSTASPKLDNSQEERRETPFRWLYLLLGGGILIVFLVWWARSRSS
jgi:hypothetical protein